MSRERFVDGTPDDLDLDALMARVREAANVVIESAAAPAPAADADAGPAADSHGEWARALAAQGAWNERMTRSLALAIECLQSLQDAVHELERRARLEHGRPAAGAKPRGGRVPARRSSRAGGRGGAP